MLKVYKSKKVIKQLKPKFNLKPDLTRVLSSTLRRADLKYLPKRRKNLNILPELKKIYVWLNVKVAMVDLNYNLNNQIEKIPVMGQWLCTEFELYDYLTRSCLEIEENYESGLIVEIEVNVLDTRIYE